MRKAPRNVDAYIASAPKAMQGKLKVLRAAIRKAAPKALEKISYGMPYYAYQGRLVYFGHHQAHIGVYFPTPTLQQHAKDLKGYYARQATLHLPLDKKIPAGLIRKLVQSRMKQNEKKR